MTSIVLGTLLSPLLPSISVLIDSMYSCILSIQNSLALPLFLFTSNLVCIWFEFYISFCPGLLIAVAPRYRYCSGATFTVAVAVAPILLAQSSGDGSAATF